MILMADTAANNLQIVTIDNKYPQDTAKVLEKLVPLVLVTTHPLAVARGDNHPLEVLDSLACRLAAAEVDILDQRPCLLELLVVYLAGRTKFHLLAAAAEASTQMQGSNNEIRPPVGGIKRRETTLPAASKNMPPDENKRPEITRPDENKKRNVNMLSNKLYSNSKEEEHLLVRVG